MMRWLRSLNWRIINVILMAMLSGALLFTVWNVTPTLTVDHLVSVIGTGVGALGLLFGTYFAVLAVDAYSHARSLRDARQSVESIAERLESIQRSITTIESDVANTSRQLFTHGHHVFAALGQFVNSLPKVRTAPQQRQMSDTKRIIEVARARFGIQDPFIDDAALESHILTIRENGDRESLAALRTVANQASRPESVKVLAHAAVIEIERRGAPNA